jgi:TetR/AcrR family transcriptional regulator
MGIHERKEREKEQRNEDILDAAQQVFFEKGLLIATMDEIAETAELSKGTLYLYYKSKEDLYLAVMMRGSHKLAEMFQRVIDSGATTLRKIIGIGEAYNEFFRTNPNYFRMIHYSQLPYFHRQVSAEMRGTCGIEHQKVWDLVFGIFKKGMEENLIRPDVNPAELAIIIWSSSTALMLRIDNEHQVWKERMNIDLQNTLQLSNKMLFEAMLTDVGRAQMQAVN